MSAGSPSKTDVIIVGAGIFGVSTALWMLKTGKYNVTIVDKSKILPAPDAASTDLNKIIRAGDYADADIAALNVDAVKEWRKPEWKGTYHESGVLCLGDNGSANKAFVDSAYVNCKKMGLPVRKTPTSEDVRAAFPAHLVRSGKIGALTNVQGYLNPVSGWAEAGRAVAVGLERLDKGFGATIRPGCEVVGLVEQQAHGSDKNVVKGVKLANGQTLKADLVVIAAGAWTPALFAQPGMGGLPQTVATGQCVATIQLTDEEAKEYADVPVMFDLSDGFYVFPPNPSKIMKVAIHGSGYLNHSNPPNPASTNEESSQKKGVSVPRTALTPGAEKGYIPKEMVKALRKGLTRIYPDLARKKDFLGTRLCWYLDTADGDWLIDWHPKKQGLLLATAGCGHAFKFYPNIGREILALVEGNLSPTLAAKWAFDRSKSKSRDASTDSDVRPDTKPQELRVENLATADDLKRDVQARL